MDGFETCRRLKADPATADSVILFLSARGEPKKGVKRKI
jgi:CheY-like chemotaxis protein